MIRLGINFLLMAALLPGQTAAEKPGRVSGRVTNALTGEPLRKVSVVLTPAGAQQQGMGPLGALRSGLSTVTDANGVYRIENVPPGTYRVLGERAGFLKSNQGNWSGGGGDARLDISAGTDKAEVNLRLMPQGVVSGRIVDEDGDPLEGVLVNLYRPNTRGAGMARGGPGPVAAFLGGGMNQTNDRGEFRIANVSPGRYYVLVRKLGPSVQQGGVEFGYPQVFFPGVETMAQAQRIEVAAGQEMSGLTMTLRRTRVFRVTGSVTGVSAPAESGQRGGRRGMLNGGYSVQLRLDGGYNEEQPGPPGMAGRGGAGMVTADGRFEISGVTPGAYRVLLSTFGQGGLRVVASANVNVGGDDVTGLVLSPAPLATLSGKVTVEGEAAAVNLKSVRVAVQPEMGMVMPVNPAEDGTFVLKELSLERMRVNVTAPAGAYVKALRIGGQPVPEAGLDFAAGVAGQLEVVLSTKVAQMSGTVQRQTGDAAGVVVVADAKLRPVGQRAQVDENGNYTVSGLGPGEYKVFAFEEYDGSDPELLERFAARAENVRLAEGENKSVPLKQVRYAEIVSAPR
jgi:protocatechuate 3,4-dioxygenase beta subunit